MGSTFMPVLAVGLVICILAYGENPQEYSKTFTLADSEGKIILTMTKDENLFLDGEPQSVIWTY